MSQLCQHRMGSYRRANYWEEQYDARCGKPATHVAKYPRHRPFFLCPKHTKTRLYVTEIKKGGGK